MNRPRLIQVIESWEMAGDGTDAHPCRMVIRYYTTDGEFLAERDPAPAESLEQPDEIVP